MCLGFLSLPTPSPHLQMLPSQGGRQFQQHPIRNDQDLETKVIPIAIHGNATPCMGAGKSWAKMLDVWSWTSMLFKAQSQLTMYLISVVVSTLKCTDENHHTLDTFFRKLTWSLRACYDGKWPTHDWNGDRIQNSKDLVFLSEHVVLLV